MVQTCCVKNCKSRQKRGIHISFHQFPKNPEIKEQWINAIKHDSFVHSPHLRICSKHFTADQFKQSPWSSRQVLRANAIPNKELPVVMLNEPETEPETEPELEPDVPETQHIEGRDVPSVSRIETENESTSMDEENILLEKPVRKKRKIYVGDFKAQDCTSDKENYLQIVNTTLEKKTKQIKRLHEKNRRLIKKINDLQSLVDDLRKKNMITEDVSVILSDNLPVSTKTLFKQIMQSRLKTYPTELKTFAVTLNFYSPRAYNYVRKTFNNLLPHPRTLQKWYASVACEPGFHTESINTLKIKVAECEGKGKACVCALLIDKMAIHKKIEWDGHKFVGYVDIGKRSEDITLPEAREVIVFLINCVNDRWKLPVGYFLIDGLSGRQKCNLVDMCLRILHDVKIKVCSLTFDGAASNIAMAMCLGVPLSSTCLKPCFPHPSTGEPVHLLLDPPHMLKLIRNTLGTYKVLYDENNNAIKWEHFVHLVEIQEREGLHLGTRITKRHINWFKEKMKVKLAAQTFSYSVAKAMKYLRETNYSSHFENSHSTERFIIFMNDAFDILNSRNLLAKSFKGGIQQHNKHIVFQRINEIITYITSLTHGPHREALHLGQKKTGFIGFIISLRSVMQIFHQYIDRPLNAKLQYLLVYKLSQDHLEVFFSAIRSMGGHNNNPTPRLFQAAYKKLLIHTGVTGSLQANCIEQVPTIILAMSTTKGNKMRTIHNLLDDDFENEETSHENNEDHTYYMTSFNYAENLSLYISDVVEYIAGFVIRKIKKTLQCEICLKAIESTNSAGNLIKTKNYSNVKQALTVPSSDVIHICKIAEAEIRLVEKTKQLQQKNILSKLLINILNNIRPSTFASYNDHMFDNDVEANHVLNLIKVISFYYCNIRLYHYGKTVVQHDNRIRSKLTKSIIFSNQ